MKLPILSDSILKILFIFFFASIARCLSVILNTTSNYTFPVTILKAQIVDIQGTQFLYILFSNGTISKLDSYLQYQQTIVSSNGQGIIDFQVCTKSLYGPSVPSIFATFQSRTSWVYINLLDPRIQLIDKRYSGVIKVFCIGAYYDGTQPIAQFLTVYYQDKMTCFLQDPTSNSSQKTIIMKQFNFSTYRVPASNHTIKKVTHLNYGGLNYEVSINEQGNLLISYCRQTLTIIATYMVPNLKTVSEYFVYRESVFAMRLNDSTFAVLDMVHTSNNASYLGKAALFKNFKAMRPKNDIDGDRVFIFMDRSGLVGNRSGVYKEDTPSIQTYSFLTNASLNFVVFNSTKSSFSFDYGTSTIYSYCESTNDGICYSSSVVLPCTISLYYCLECDQTFTTCSLCFSGYELFNNTCLKVTSSCSDKNCLKCFENNSCLKCYDSYILNSSLNACQIVSAPILIDSFSNNSNFIGSFNTSNPSSDTRDSSNTDDVNGLVSNESNKKFQTVFDNITWPIFSQKTIIERMLSYDKSIFIMTEISAKLNSSPIIRTILAFLSPLFSLFDDYWFYSYHQNQWQNFNIFPDFLLIMHEANEERIIPEELRFTDKIKIDQFTESKYFENYTNKKIMLIDNQMVYIADNFQDIILRQYPLLIVGFLFIKFLTIIIHFTYLRQYHNEEKRIIQVDQQSEARKKTQKIKQLTKKNIQNPTKISKDKILLVSLVRFLQELISFRSILMTFLGSNMIFVSFQLSSQMKSFFSLQFIDKVNMLLTIIFGFSFILCFLIFIHLSETLFPSVKIAKTQKSDILSAKIKQITRLKYSDMNIIFFAGIKCILYGFINGYFIDYNTLQYILLIGVKLFLIGLILIEKRIFQHQVILILKFAYFVIGIFIDFVFLGSKLNIFEEINQSNLLGFSMINIIELGFMTLLIGSVLAGVVLQGLYTFRIQCCPKGKKQRLSLDLRPLNILSVLNKVCPSVQESERISNDPSIEMRKKVSQCLSKYSSIESMSIDQVNEVEVEFTRKTSKCSRFAQMDERKQSKESLQTDYPLQSRSNKSRFAMQKLETDEILENYFSDRKTHNETQEQDYPQLHTQRQRRRDDEQNKPQNENMVRAVEIVIQKKPEERGKIKYSFVGGKRKMELKKRNKMKKVEFDTSSLKCSSCDGSQNNNEGEVEEMEV